MNTRMILRVLGYILLIFAALMLLPITAALCYRESVRPLLIPLLASALPGFALTRLPVRNTTLFARDGL